MEIRNESKEMVWLLSQTRIRSRLIRRTNEQSLFPSIQ